MLLWFGQGHLVEGLFSNEAIPFPPRNLKLMHDIANIYQNVQRRAKLAWFFFFSIFSVFTSCCEKGILLISFLFQTRDNWALMRWALAVGSLCSCFSRHSAERFRAVHLLRHEKPVWTGYNVNVIASTYLIFRGEIFHSVLFCDFIMYKWIYQPVQLCWEALLPKSNAARQCVKTHLPANPRISQAWNFFYKLKSDERLESFFSLLLNYFYCKVLEFNLDF